MTNQATILIVDDDANFCNTLVKIMERKGNIVFSAENGQRAIEMVKERPFDVILLDVKMPVMNGVAAYKIIKQICPSTVVIFMTAFLGEDIVKDAIRNGAYAIINKPLDVDVVLNMIEKSRSGALIAIVDDDPNIRKTMKQAIDKKGYSVITCSTGEEAVAMARERVYDVFFVDMKLPVLNGLDVYMEIKKLNPKAVVVIMTAYALEMKELVRQAIEEGAYSCLHKPYEMDEVIRIVEEAVARKNK